MPERILEWTCIVNADDGLADILDSAGKSILAGDCYLSDDLPGERIEKYRQDYERVFRAVNLHEELVACLQSVIDDCEIPDSEGERCLLKVKIRHKIRALLSKAKGQP